MRDTFARWSVSYNRWTGPIERVAAGQPASAWTAYKESHHTCVRHQLEGCARSQVYAVRRWRGKDERFDR